MAITQAGGHMIHVTTTADRTSGLARASNDTRLAAAFPRSPMLGDGADYSAAQVRTYKYKILTNTVKTGEGSDRGAAQGYWGFPSPEAEETSASSADLSFTGAPDLDAAPALADPPNLASNYMPNLVVPPLDAPTTPVATEATTMPSAPPGVGNGLANPSETTAAIQTALVESQNPDNTPVVAAHAWAGGEAARLPATD